MSALLTTAVDDSAILPAVFVVHAAVGKSVICPPPLEAIVLGGVILAIGAAVPEIKVIILVGAMVLDAAIVGAVALVEITPEIEMSPPK